MFEGIRNLIKWFPIIWKDRDFDYVFLLLVLQKKLEFMRKSFAKYDYLRCKKTIHRMRVCELLLDRIIHEDRYLIDGKRYLKPLGGNAAYWNYLLNQDLDYLFKILRKHIEGFW